MYYINLTGEEFPLVTNMELVTILSQLKGDNIVEGNTCYTALSEYPMLENLQKIHELSQTNINNFHNFDKIFASVLYNVLTIRGYLGPKKATNYNFER